MADILSHLDNDRASLPSFTAWVQETDISKTLNATIEYLTLPVPSLIISLRSLELLDSSATALWNVFVRFLRRVGVENIKTEVARGMNI